MKANKLVCKIFFLNLLVVSQTVIYNVHLKKNPITLTPPDEKRGKTTVSKIPIERKNFAIQHIKSYPAI